MDKQRPVFVCRDSGPLSPDEVQRLEQLLRDLQKPMFVYTNNKALLRENYRRHFTMKQVEAKEKLVDSRLQMMHDLIMAYALHGFE